MRLIIKEYLAKLREKDELDVLLCDLLLAQEYITDNVPKTGNRQYGVDIQVHNAKELVLCVVKQGNINRSVWDGNENSVRGSLNEIKDVYLRMLSKAQLKKRIRIVVVTNGFLDEAVRPNWESYVEQNQEWNRKKIEIEFWNIDKLVDDIWKYLLNEFLFDKNMQSLLRKGLYFVTEPDYKNLYFENIIDSYMERLEYTIMQKKQFQKEMSSLLLSTQMIVKYAVESDVNKIGIRVNEYLIIKYWKFLFENNLFEKQRYIEWLLRFNKCYEDSCKAYFHAVNICCSGECEIPSYNMLEQKVLLYEMLGYLASYAFYEIEYAYLDGKKITDTIIHVINKNMQFYSPLYDGDIGIINIILRLLQKQKRYEDMKKLVCQICYQLIENFRFNEKYPTPLDDFRDAANIEFGNQHEEYRVSGMWAMLLEWIAILEERELYEHIQNFLQNDLKDVTKCAWFLREKEEAFFYEPYAMQRAGEGIALEIGKTYEEFSSTLYYIFDQYKREQFSYEKYSFESLEMITCRYFGYIPKVSLQK